MFGPLAVLPPHDHVVCTQTRRFKTAQPGLQHRQRFDRCGASRSEPEYLGYTKWSLCRFKAV